MKQINIQLISLNKTKFEKSLFFITLLSLLALATTVLELHFVPNLLNLKPEIIKNTNNLINDLSIGIIASFIFYVIVQWIPEKNKEKKSLIIVEKNLIKLTNEIDFFILTYSNLLMNKKDINTLVKSDFDKIGFFELYKCESEFVKQFNTNRDEVIYVLIRLKTIFTEIGIILKSPYIEYLPDDLILKFYELRDLDFHEKVEYIYKINDYFFDDKDKLKLNGYNFSLNYIEDNKSFLSDNLFKIYKLNKIYKRFITTSSSSKQSS